MMMKKKEKKRRLALSSQPNPLLHALLQLPCGLPPLLLRAPLPVRLILYLILPLLRPLLLSALVSPLGRLAPPHTHLPHWPMLPQQLRHLLISRPILLLPPLIPRPVHSAHKLASVRI